MRGCSGGFGSGGFRVEEVAIVRENRDESKVAASDAAGMLLGMLRIRFG